MGVYKRTLSSGAISWVADYIDPATGKRKREQFSKKKYADACQEQVIYRGIRGEPLGGKASKTTIGELVDDFKKKCIEQAGEDHWNRNRKFAIERFQEHFGRTTLAAAIRYRHIEDYRDWLVRLPTRRKAKRAGATTNRELTQIRKMFRRGVERELVAQNPFTAGSSLRVQEKKRDSYLKKEEFHKLMDAAADHLQPIIFTAVATGLRRGNLLNLTWDLVDLDKNRIRIPGRMVKNNVDLKIPIVPSLHKVFKDIRKNQMRVHLVSGRKGKPPKYVFTYTKKIYGRLKTAPIGEIKNAFRAACRRAEIDDIRFNDLRHTHATALINAGVDVFMIGSLLGHSWTNQTMDYAHVNWESRAKAILHIEEFISDMAAAYQPHAAKNNN